MITKFDSLFAGHVDLDNIGYGGADTVTRKLSTIIERLNPGYLHIYGNEGDMPHAEK